MDFFVEKVEKLIPGYTPEDVTKDLNGSDFNQFTEEEIMSAFNRLTNKNGRALGLLY